MNEKHGPGGDGVNVGSLIREGDGFALNVRGNELSVSRGENRIPSSVEEKIRRIEKEKMTDYFLVANLGLIVPSSGMIVQSRSKRTEGGLEVLEEEDGEEDI